MMLAATLMLLPRWRALPLIAACRPMLLRLSLRYARDFPLRLSLHFSRHRYRR